MGAVVLGDSGQIFGRVPAVGVVRALMTRPRPDRMPHSLNRPVLVFEGARGSGKTALLNTLVGLLDQRVPYARVDLEGSPQAASVPDVLSALAFELGSRCGQYGELRFPRFVIGRLVLHERLDLDDHQRACRQVMTMLAKERNFDTVRKLLAETAGELLDAATRYTPVPITVLRLVSKHLSGMVLQRLTSWAPSRRVVLRGFHDWYGSRGRGLTNDALDVLVGLNRWGCNLENDDNRQRIEELLWDAFLTDLREAFRGSRHAAELTFNAVALLDNVDTELGQRFLHGLVRTRRQGMAEGKLSPDPLTVLVTSRGTLLADLPAAGVAELPAGAQAVAALDRQENGARVWWARYRLTDLTEDETAAMVSALVLREGNNERLTRMVHELTGGHPAATRLVVDAIAERPEHRDELAAILDVPEPGGGPERLRVDERLRRRLLAGFPEDVFEDLVTCAAARNRHDAARFAEHSELLDGGTLSYEVVKEVLWPVADGAASRLLRRLLLRLLSRRIPGDRPDWSQVFSWLSADCDQEGDQPGQLYYALAVPDLALVTGRLREQLTQGGLVSWLPILIEVTSAPRRAPGEADTLPAPVEQMRAALRTITPSGQPTDPLSRLIVSLWIVGDPLTDSRRTSLHRQLDADHRGVAASLSGDTDLLLRAADNHRRQATLWN